MTRSERIEAAARQLLEQARQPREVYRGYGAERISEVGAESLESLRAALSLPPEPDRYAEGWRAGVEAAAAYCYDQSHNRAVMRSCEALGDEIRSLAAPPSATRGDGAHGHIWKLTPSLGWACSFCGEPAPDIVPGCGDPIRVACPACDVPGFTRAELPLHRCAPPSAPPPSPPVERGEIERLTAEVERLTRERDIAIQARDSAECQTAEMCAERNAMQRERDEGAARLREAVALLGDVDLEGFEIDLVPHRGAWADRRAAFLAASGAQEGEGRP